jgi:hypothetical protein
VDTAQLKHALDGKALKDRRNKKAPFDDYPDG